MSIQIANPQVVDKIERLAQAMGMGKTAAVDAAVDRMLSEVTEGAADQWGRLDAIVTQMRRLPTRADAFDAVPYDDFGLPK